VAEPHCPVLEGHDHTRQPAQFLIDNVDLLPVGRALDVAMGEGRNAIFLATRGFEVEGVDISADAVAGALKAAQQAGVSIRATVTDIERGYTIQQNTYDVIVCFHYLQRSLIPQIKDGLKADGVVVYETFIVDQVQFGRPRNPAYLLKHNELLRLFSDFRCLRYREGIVEGRKAIAGIVAQKGAPSHGNTLA
jgi:tellurite methyltransferase